MLTLLLFLIPIIAAILLLNFNRFRSELASNVAELFSIFSFVLYCYSQSLFNVNQKNKDLDFNIPWLKEFSINFHLGWDGLSALMLGLTSSVVLLIVFFIRSYNYENKNRLYALLFFTQTALVGIFASKDIFVFYFFFEAALIPIYLIANFWGGKNASKITFKMLIYTVFGSLFMLVAIITIAFRLQASDFETIKTSISLLSNEIKLFIFAAFTLAFAIKMPIFPFHSWLPDAYSESPTPVSMMLSGLLSKMGVFGLLKIVIPFAPTEVSNYSNVLMAISIFGLIYGSIIAIQQDNIKKLIAYSSFAHMGIIAAAIFTQSADGLNGAICQIIAHGFNVVGLFAIAKIIYDRTGSRSLQNIGGLAQNAPKLAVAFLIILLGSVALPLTNGFVGEFLMLKSIFSYNAFLGIISGLSVVFGAVYMLRFYQMAMYGAAPAKPIEDLNSQELLVLIPIILAILVFGLFPSLIFDISKIIKY